MTVLSTFAPRSAGDVLVEPLTVFDEIELSVQSGDRCPLTCGCSLTTNHCVSTGITSGCNGAEGV